MQLHTNANEHIVQENIETGVALLWKLHCCWYLGLVQKKENIPWSFTVKFESSGRCPGKKKRNPGEIWIYLVRNLVQWNQEPSGRFLYSIVIKCVYYRIN
jgi:hypothetical protein